MKEGIKEGKEGTIGYSVLGKLASKLFDSINLPDIWCYIVLSRLLPVLLFSLSLFFSLSPSNLHE